jgi:hypothetical protein
MFDFTSKLLNELHMVALAAKRLCAGYWSGLTSQFDSNTEQNPIKMASFYKESRNT